MFGNLSANLKSPSSYSSHSSTSNGSSCCSGGSCSRKSPPPPKYVGTQTPSQKSSCSNGSCCASGVCSQPKTTSSISRTESDLDAELKKALSSLNADELKESGNKFYKMGKFAEALKLYDRAVVTEPRVAQYRANRAAALAGLGRLEEAIKDCKDAIAIDVNHGRAHQRLANLLIRSGRFEEARTALRVAPSGDITANEVYKLEKIEGYVKKAEELVAKEEWKGVLREVTLAIDSGADQSMKLLKWKAQAFFQVKQLEEADEVIEVVLKLESGSSGIKKPESTPNSYLLKANIDVALGRFDQALSSVQSALSQGANSEAANEVKQVAEALNSARARGNDYYRAGDFQSAIDMYSRGLDGGDPTNALLLCNRSACKSKINNWQAALEDAEAALISYPTYVKAMLRRSACLMKLSMWEDAAESYCKILEYLPEDPEILKLLAEAKVNLAQRNGAPVLPKPIMEGGQVVEITNPHQYQTIVENFNLVVVDFFATWCGPCKQIAPLITRLAGQYRNARFIKIDIDKCRELAMDENIRSVPTFKVFRQGKEVDEIAGANGPELQRILSSYSGN